MAVQPDPPIQIDPSIDSGHQWAFVNQNFQSIANVLSKQSFSIVGKFSDTFTLTAAGTALTNLGTITHNLGYSPTIIATVTFTTLTNGSVGTYPVPYWIPFTTSADPNIFVMGNFIAFSNINSTVVQYLIGATPSTTIAGTITIYITQIVTS